jgi:hypothetical protein
MTNTPEISVGQRWSRRGVEAEYRSPGDLITILDYVSRSDEWVVHYDSGEEFELPEYYIHQEFELLPKHPEAITFEDLDGVVLTVQPGHAYAKNLLLEMSVPGQIVLRPGQIDELIGWLQTHRRLNGDN